MEHQAPPLFARDPAPLVRLAFFAGLAIFLMVLDARFRYAEALRQGLAVITYPIQRLALAPVQMLSGAADYFSSQVQLRRENDELRSRQLKVSKDLQTFEALEAENAQLRRLLEARLRLPRKSTFAEILYSGRDPFSRKVIIDKGGNDGISPGLAVVDEVGVIGQVTRVYPLLAEVTLITDKGQLVPVLNMRNGLRAVLAGTGSDGTLELKFIPLNADFQNGDRLVTSGIDGIYPKGFAIGWVESARPGPTPRNDTSRSSHPADRNIPSIS